MPMQNAMLNIILLAFIAIASMTCATLLAIDAALRKEVKDLRKEVKELREKNNKLSALMSKYDSFANSLALQNGPIDQFNMLEEKEDDSMSTEPVQ